MQYYDAIEATREINALVQCAPLLLQSCDPRTSTVHCAVWCVDRTITKLKKTHSGKIWNDIYDYF